MAEIGVTVRCGFNWWSSLMVTRALQYCRDANGPESERDADPGHGYGGCGQGVGTGEKCGGLENRSGVEGELSAFAIHEEQDQNRQLSSRRMP